MNYRWRFEARAVSGGYIVETTSPAPRVADEDDDTIYTEEVVTDREGVEARLRDFLDAQIASQ